MDHADCMTPARQHELDHTDHTYNTDHTDHTDQEYIWPQRCAVDHQVGIDELSDL